MDSRHRRCEECGGPLAWDARSHARFCSTRCRTAAHRERARRAAVLAVEEQSRTEADVLPAELRTADRWVRWRKVIRNYRPTKMPLTLTGQAASSTDPTTWTDYASASASDVGDGIGFVLSEADDIVCIDFDHCLVDGRPLPALRKVLRSMPATFTTVSVSGDGIHVWGRSSRLRAGRRTSTPDGLLVEAYPHGRYMAESGVRFDHAPDTLANLDDVLEELLGRLD